MVEAYDIKPDGGGIQMVYAFDGRKLMLTDIALDGFVSEYVRSY